MTTNEVGTSGLITKPLSEIISDLQSSFYSIYGADINLNSNSPDGQLIGIISQQIVDLLDLITQVYNSFDPDSAEGSVLDSRVAINGIQRIGGSYTITPVSITVDRSLTLYGLDQTVQTPFTVADDAGNQFQLIETQTPTAGTASYDFQAVNLGAIQTQLDTITIQITVVVGVTAVNNPSAASVIGQNQESDADLKLRRQISMAIGSTGTIDSMLANLLNVSGVTDAYVYENYTGSDPDGQGVSAHTIWPIVEGGDSAYIGAVVYAKKSGGCNMKGSVTPSVRRANGEYFTAQFDRPIYVPLYIKFTLTAKSSGAPAYDPVAVKAALVAALSYRIYQKANTQEIFDLLTTIVPLYTPTLLFNSIDDANWYEILTPATPQKKFTVSTAHITIS